MYSFIRWAGLLVTHSTKASPIFKSERKRKRGGMVAMDRTLGPLCTVICIALLVAGFWPLDFYPKNRVSWLEARNGLAFQGDALGPGYSPGGLLLSPEQLGPENSASSEKGTMSIELWLRPYGEPGGCRYNILGLYDESKRNLFFVGQWKSHRSSGSGKRKEMDGNSGKRLAWIMLSKRAQRSF
jgi:hypothetical protein